MSESLNWNPVGLHIMYLFICQFYMKLCIISEFSKVNFSGLTDLYIMEYLQLNFPFVCNQNGFHTYYIYEVYLTAYSNLTLHPNKIVLENHSISFNYTYYMSLFIYGQSVIILYMP